MAGAGRPEAPLSAEVQVSLTEKPEGEGPRARAATLNLALWKEPGSEGCAPWGTGTEGDWLSRVGSASQRDCGWLALRETPEMSPASPELFGPWAVYAPLGRRCPAWTPILTCSSLHRGYPPPGSPPPFPFLLPFPSSPSTSILLFLILLFKKPLNHNLVGLMSNRKLPLGQGSGVSGRQAWVWTSAWPGAGSVTTRPQPLTYDRADLRVGGKPAAMCGGSEQRGAVTHAAGARRGPATWSSTPPPAPACWAPPPPPPPGLTSPARRKPRRASGRVMLVKQSDLG